MGVALSMVGSKIPVVITRLDNQTTASLTMAQQYEETYKQEVSRLPVLYTNNPLVKYKYSEDTFELAEVNLFDNHRPVESTLKWLIECTKVVAATQPLDSPTLSLAWGEILKPRVKLAQMRVSRRMMLNGSLTHAVIDLSFVECPEYPKPKTAPKPAANTVNSKTLKLSEREREEYAKQVAAKLKSDTKKATEVNYKPNSVVKVSENGEVLIDGRKADKLTDYGITVKPSHPIAPNTPAVNIPKASSATDAYLDRNPLEQFR